MASGGIKRHALWAAIIVAGCVFAADSAWAHTVAAPKRAKPEELIPPHDAAYFVKKLESADEGEWREGQIGLAMRGGGLAELDALLRRADAEQRKRIRAALKFAMLKSITWDDLKRYPHLAALVLNDVEEGMELAKEITTPAETFREINPDDLLRMNAARGEPTRLERFQELSGCSVPAIQWLCAHERPELRGVGLSLMYELKATVGRRDIERLKKDAGEAELHDRTSMIGVSVGRRPLREWAQLFDEKMNKADCLAAAIEENVLDTMRAEGPIVDHFEDLYNGAYQYVYRDDFETAIGKSMELRPRIKWDDWWRAGRALLTVYRETHGPEQTQADKERWWRHKARCTSRMTLTRTDNADGSSVFRVLGPAGGYCKLYEDDELVAEGPLPLETKRRSKINYPSGGFVVRVTADGCKPWWTSLASHNGRTFVVECFKDYLK
jgi:hypothetical protein